MTPGIEIRINDIFFQNPFPSFGTASRETRIAYAINPLKSHDFLNDLKTKLRTLLLSNNASLFVAKGEFGQGKSALLNFIDTLVRYSDKIIIDDLLREEIKEIIKGIKEKRINSVYYTYKTLDEDLIDIINKFRDVLENTDRFILIIDEPARVLFEYSFDAETPTEKEVRFVTSLRRFLDIERKFFEKIGMVLAFSPYVLGFITKWEDVASRVMRSIVELPEPDVILATRAAMYHLLYSIKDLNTVEKIKSINPYFPFTLDSLISLYLISRAYTSELLSIVIPSIREYIIFLHSAFEHAYSYNTVITLDKIFTILREIGRLERGGKELNLAGINYEENEKLLAKEYRLTDKDRRLLGFLIRGIKWYTLHELSHKTNLKLKEIEDTLYRLESKGLVEREEVILIQFLKTPFLTRDSIKLSNHIHNELRSILGHEYKNLIIYHIIEDKYAILLFKRYVPSSKNKELLNRLINLCEKSAAQQIIVKEEKIFRASNETLSKIYNISKIDISFVDLRPQIDLFMKFKDVLRVKEKVQKFFKEYEEKGAKLILNNLKRGFEDLKLETEYDERENILIVKWDPLPAPLKEELRNKYNILPSLNIGLYFLDVRARELAEKLEKTVQRAFKHLKSMDLDAIVILYWPPLRSLFSQIYENLEREHLESKIKGLKIKHRLTYVALTYSDLIRIASSDLEAIKTFIRKLNDIFLSIRESLITELTEEQRILHFDMLKKPERRAPILAAWHSMMYKLKGAKKLDIPYDIEELMKFAKYDEIKVIHEELLSRQRSYDEKTIREDIAYLNKLRPQNFFTREGGPILIHPEELTLRYIYSLCKERGRVSKSLIKKFIKENFPERLNYDVVLAFRKKQDPVYEFIVNYMLKMKGIILEEEDHISVYDPLDLLGSIEKIIEKIKKLEEREDVMKITLLGESKVLACKIYRYYEEKDYINYTHKLGKIVLTLKKNLPEVLRYVNSDMKKFSELISGLSLIVDLARNIEYGANEILKKYEERLSALRAIIEEFNKLKEEILKKFGKNIPLSLYFYLKSVFDSLEFIADMINNCYKDEMFEKEIEECSSVLSNLRKEIESYDEIMHIIKENTTKIKILINNMERRITELERLYEHTLLKFEDLNKVFLEKEALYAFITSELGNTTMKVIKEIPKTISIYKDLLDAIKYEHKAFTEEHIMKIYMFYGLDFLNEVKCLSEKLCNRLIKMGRTIENLAIKAANNVKEKLSALYANIDNIKNKEELLEVATFIRKHIALLENYKQKEITFANAINLLKNYIEILTEGIEKMRSYKVAILCKLLYNSPGACVLKDSELSALKKEFVEARRHIENFINTVLFKRIKLVERSYTLKV